MGATCATRFATSMMPCTDTPTVCTLQSALSVYTPQALAASMLPYVHTWNCLCLAERQAPPGGAAVQVKFRQWRPAGVQTSSSSASAAARAGAVQILPSIDGSTPVTPGKLEQAAEDTPRNTSPSVSSQALHRLRQMVRGPSSSSGAGERGGCACTAAVGAAAAAVLRPCLLAGRARWLGALVATRRLAARVAARCMLVMHSW